MSLWSRLLPWKSPSLFVPPLTSDVRALLKDHKGFRYLKNDALQRRVRSPFYDVERLAEVVVRVTGASHCTGVQKLQGGHNDHLFITTNNGKEVVARIPYGTAGPPRLGTQSEVATLDFLRNHLGLPVPTVLAWSDSTDEIGSEFVVFEKMQGEPMGAYLHRLFSDPPCVEDYADKLKPAKSLLSAYSAFEAKLSGVRFSQFGSIFYEEHVSAPLRLHPLYAPGVPEDAASRRFRIGPSVERSFYRGGRAQLDVNRGPWTSASDYIRSVIECEEAWISQHADTGHGRKLAGDGAGSAVTLSALDFFKRVRTEYLAASVGSPLDTPTLWHPDPGRNNFLVSEEPDGSVALTGLLDWQGACVRPWYKCVDDPACFNLPPSLKYINLPHDATQVELPAGFLEFRANAAEDERRAIDAEVLVATLYTTHRALLSAQAGPAARKSLTHPLLRVLRSVEDAVPYVWNFGLGTFVYGLKTLQTTYASLDAPPPPLLEWASSSDQQLADEAQADALWINGSQTFLYNNMASQGIVTDADGRVVERDFDKAGAVAEDTLHALLEGADAEGTTRMRHLWPMREGSFSESAETCS